MEEMSSFGMIKRDSLTWLVRRKFVTNQERGPGVVISNKSEKKQNRTYLGTDNLFPNWKCFKVRPHQSEWAGKDVFYNIDFPSAPPAFDVAIHYGK